MYPPQQQNGLAQQQQLQNSQQGVMDQEVARRQAMAKMLAEPAQGGANGSKEGIASSALAGALKGFMQHQSDAPAGDFIQPEIQSGTTFPVQGWGGIQVQDLPPLS